MSIVSSRFEVGAKVLVLDLRKTGHVRTPFYVRGRTGIVIQRCGSFLNPEDLSVGNVGGPVIPLYRVGFRMVDLWSDYKGPQTDYLCIEIYDHWLESAPTDGTKGSGVAA